MRFQSAPANYGGRIRRGATRVFRRRVGFNPRPPITAGESALGAAVLRVYCDVSIRARQLRRANRRMAHRRHPGAIRCFNPRPPITAGESARPAAPDGRYPFQSAPANYGGRIWVTLRKIVRLRIVSIRARQLRRANQCGFNLCLQLTGFNPRPPITAGESIVDYSTGECRIVSIRARQLRRANPFRGCTIGPRNRFQSAPANYGGRILFGPI